MKNFLLFTLEFPPAIGGVANYYENLVRFWDGPMAVLAQGECGGKCQDSETVFYRSLSTPFSRPQYLPAVFQLGNIVIKKKIKHVIVGQILPLGTIAFYLSKILKFEYSIILHGLDLSLALRPEKRELSLRILKRAQKIICANSHAAEILETADISLSDKITMVNPGVAEEARTNKECEERLKAQYSLAGKKIIFSLGRLVKRKGFDKMILALPEIATKEKNVFLAMAGEGPEKEYLEKMIAALPDDLKKNVALLGEITEEEKAAWFALCDFFALPAREINGDFEGFGIVYLEANLHGKAVLAGRSGGVGDAVVDGLNGLLVDPEDINEIAGGALKLLSDKKLRGQMGTDGEARARRDFDWAGQVKKIKKALNN